jgi:AraC-like DNA-binding protein
MSSASINIKDKTQPKEDIKISHFRKEVRKTAPHKHNNYFEIIYLSNGNGFHTIDSRKFPVLPPVVFFVRKEQTHHFDLEMEPDGFVAIIKKTFIEKSLDNELKLLLTQLSSQNCIFLSESQTIEHIFQLLVHENSVKSNHSFHIIEGLLKALLAKMLEVAKPTLRSSTTKSDLFQSFHELLQADAVVKNSVQHYADLLNTSPQNLNAACRKAVNQSATEVLAEFIISEAKRLLLYTNNTVSQIAFSLGFIDASHFVKYFKRVTGLTPQTFRLSSE